MSLTIRRARADEADLVFTLMKELAAYEKLDTPEFFEMTVEIVARDITGPSPKLIAEIAEWDGGVAGLCLWYRTYSSFRAGPAMFLEDLFVRDAYRGKGIGKAFLKYLAAVAVQEGARRIDWFVLDWNETAIRFYDGIGARPHEGWISYRLTGQALKDLAAS